MELYLRCWRKYVDFTGRASLAEFWVFTLVNVVVYAVLAFGLRSIQLPAILSFAVFIPSVAVGARRLHDSDRSAWWLLLGLVPIGNLVLPIFMLLAGSPHENRYGPNPNAV